ncbi:MAG TPA: hypothetical protein PKC67_06660 [Kiritimatiellia bacterium]|nr:hypothetical protein [Kiritimatiellia bacterium]HMP34017.1 hypothetical protein [Kiritimatiellia bacterium]
MILNCPKSRQDLIRRKGAVVFGGIVWTRKFGYALSLVFDDHAMALFDQLQQMRKHLFRFDRLDLYGFHITSLFV